MALNSLLYVNSKTITTGGTVQQVLSPGTGPGADTPSLATVMLKARKGNTSPLYLGVSTTGGGANGSALSSTTGFELQPGDAVAMDLMGLGSAYIIGATTNDRYDILGIGA